MKHPLSFLSVALALALDPFIAARAAETAALSPTDIAAVKELEEIVVTGDRTLSGARQAIVEAEDRFYARYNELNKVDAFDINCRMVTPTGSRLSYRACVPRYVDEEAQADAARLFMSSSVGGNVMVSSAASIGSSLMPELKKRTLELVRKDPELLRALLERARLQQYYDELRKETFKGRWVVWD